MDRHPAAILSAGYDQALEILAAAKRTAYRRGFIEGIAVGLALALMVWALSR